MPAQPAFAKTFADIAARLMRCPAVPYQETAMREVAQAFCAEHGLAAELDRHGNLIVRLAKAPKQRPLVLAAHLDHPGFEVLPGSSRRRWKARFLGGVPEHYFRAGVPLRLLPGGEPARLGKALPGKKGYWIQAEVAPKQKPVAAVWELPDFQQANGRIIGRACDDLIGCATILTVLAELARRRAKAHVIGVLSRAEEVGFQGALLAASAGSLPKQSLVISLETSRELPPVKMGQGVILRVGDRSSTFDPAATRFLAEVAGDLRKADAKFLFQRALMSGGTCEATAYQELGFQTAAVCVALGNYHNCGPRNRIAAEYVSRADAWSMVTLLITAASRFRHYDALIRRLPKRLARLTREARREFRRVKIEPGFNRRKRREQRH